MTTLQLIVLRIYMVTVGRIGVFAGLLRQILVFFLVKKGPRKYNASSRFFDVRELGQKGIDKQMTDNTV